MNTEQLYKITYLVQLLEELTPVIGRYLHEEVPLILAHERAFDHHRQMCLPLTYPLEDTQDRDSGEIP